MTPTLVKYVKGFATNSSSCHSIVKKSDELAKLIVDDNLTKDHEYEWSPFKIKSLEAKIRYLLITAHENAYGMSYNLNLDDDDEFIDAMMYDLGKSLKKNCDTFCDIWKEFNEADYGWSIDHASVLTIPFDIWERKYDLLYWDWLVNQILDETVVIYGGNDNCMEKEWDIQESYIDYHPDKGDVLLSLMVDKRVIGYSFKDENNDIINVTFDPFYGTKKIINLTSDKTEIIYKHPLLCDIKITDCCYGKCAHCYQESTPDGNHVDLYRLNKIAKILKKNKVFEVAIGGGDALEHPNLNKIIDIFNENGVTTNITINPRSRKLERYDATWCNLIASIDSIKKCSGIGVSSNIEYAKALKAALTYLLPEKRKTKDDFILCGVDCDRREPQISPHLIAGVDFSNGKDLEEMIKECNEAEMTPLLLGYKNVGRGKTSERYQQNAIKMRMDKSLFKKFDPEYDYEFSVDTAFVTDYEDQLEEYGADKRTYHKTEGEQSFYIDAVNDSCGVSSYETDKIIKYSCISGNNEFSLENIIKNRYKIFEL